MANQRIAFSVTDLAPQHISAISNGERSGEYAQPNYSSASDAVIVDFGQTMSCLYPNAGSFAFNTMLQMPEIDEVAFMECEDHTITDPVQLALTDPACACEQSTYWARMYGANCNQENVKYCCSAAETPCGALAKSRGYHPDYLGSIEAVTDARGEVYQFFHNTIWGEPLQDQRAVLYNNFTSPYRFNEGRALRNRPVAYFSEGARLPRGQRDWESGNFYYGARYYDPKISVWLGVDPLAEKNNFESPYVFVHNNPLIYVDPDGRDGILVVFPDYKVDTETRLGKQPLGHAGVLLIDNKTGYTRYYEYGRYATTDGTKGKVRNVRVSNVVIDPETGKPTQESLNKVLGQISKEPGQNGRIQGAYVEGDFDKMNDYAQGKLNESDDPNHPDYNKDREPYSLTRNNCGTFSCDVLKQDPEAKKKAPWIFIPTPDNMAEEYQDNFPKVDYNPETKTTTSDIYKKED